MPPRLDPPTHLLTSIHGLPQSPIVSIYQIEEDDDGAYIVAFGGRHFVSFEKGFAGHELRLYFDLAKTEPDPLGGNFYRHLRSGLNIEDAKRVDIDLSGKS